MSQSSSSLAERAQRLRDLHQAGQPLVLPNAWDAASARVLAAAGFPALATTSGGIAATLGYPDGERIAPDEMLGVVARIATAVDVPVTADLEAGYGLDPAELVERLLDAGAVGCNVEDSDYRGGGGLVDLDVHARRLAEIKQAGRERGVDVVLNARLDVFLRGRGTGSDEQQLEEALRRGQCYCAAGADCVYPITLADEPAIARLVDELGCPINVFLRAGMPSIARLAQLGVARLSVGSGLHQAALRWLEQAAGELRAGGTDWLA